jgi:hypothetical protein
MIGVQIADPATNRRVRVLEDGPGYGALCYTEDATKFTRVAKPFLNDDYGVDMAQDASAGGTPDIIHNGLDSVAWTASNIAGTAATFNSTAQAQAGTQSIAWTPAAGSIIQFDKGSAVNLANYESITMWIYVDRRWGTDNVQLYAWDLAGGLVIGNTVNLEDYFEQSTFGVWEKLSIPLADLGIANESIQYLRIQCVTVDFQSPDFYIDSFEIQETGSPLSYSVQLSADKVYYMDFMRIIATATLAGTNLDYSRFMGLTLNTGMVFARTRSGETAFTANLRSLFDLQWGGLDIRSTITNGTTTSLAFELAFGSPLILDRVAADKLSLTISEDFSGLLNLRAITYGREVDPDRSAS